MPFSKGANEPTQYRLAAAHSMPNVSFMKTSLSGQLSGVSGVGVGLMNGGSDGIGSMNGGSVGSGVGVGIVSGGSGVGSAVGVGSTVEVGSAVGVGSTVEVGSAAGVGSAVGVGVTRSDAGGGGGGFSVHLSDDSPHAR